jgi:hypothetical protein
MQEESNNHSLSSSIDEPLSIIMLLIHVNLKEKAEGIFLDPSHLDIVHFVEITITLLSIVIRSMDIQIQIALMKLRLNQEVAMMYLHLTLPVFLRRSMINCLACYNR